MRRFLIIVLLIIILFTLFVGSCAANSKSSTPAPSSNPAATSATLANTQTPTLATNKVLKIGVDTALGVPMGLDMKRSLEVMADMDNANGGLLIGGDRYTIQFIIYDNNNEQATAMAALNRLISQDKVKFVLAAEGFVDAMIPTTEANKIVYLGRTPTPPILSPNVHYAFQGAFDNEMAAGFFGWFISKFPDKNDIVLAVPDNQLGHILGNVFPPVAKSFGVEITDIFYPATATDLSAVATKIKTLNPGGVIAAGGSDALVYKSVYEAGYRGQLCANSTMPASTLMAVVPPEDVEGFINEAWPVEFDTPPTQAAKDFKAAYIAKYGKWESPEIVNTALWSCLRAALQQAGNLDADKVATVIGNGLKYEGPTGPAIMVSRPDMGNNRTVDSIVGLFMKQIEGGKVKLLDTVTLDEADILFKKYLANLSAAGPPAK
jgi:branched-chain amino acid transport system substrate-binding protein